LRPPVGMDYKAGINEVYWKGGYEASRKTKDCSTALKKSQVSGLLDIPSPISIPHLTAF